MKLANALAQRSNLQMRLIELENRLKNNAKVLEGEEPAEKPEDLLKEMDDTLSQLEVLMTKINLLNSTTYKDGVSLTQMLALRDCLKMRMKMMRNFLDAASCKVDRYSKTEIPIKSSVNVSELQKEVDHYAKELRQLDEMIQELNWTTEI